MEHSFELTMEDYTIILNAQAPFKIKISRIRRGFHVSF